jgi:dihydrofolate reductase
VVFSRTLESVEGNARLARDSVPEEVRRLKEQVDGDLAVGGAALAANCIELDLVDEYRLFVHPVIVGGPRAKRKRSTPTRNPAFPQIAGADVRVCR